MYFSIVYIYIDIKFLTFFFQRLRINETGRYPEFPYLSPCGRETNFVRCDDLPVVLTSLTKQPSGETILACNYCGDKLVVPFQPSKLYMGLSGRIYHPGLELLHGVALVKSQLAIELARDFRFQGADENTPSHFLFEDQLYRLDNSLKDQLIKLGRTE